MWTRLLVLLSLVAHSHMTAGGGLSGGKGQAGGGCGEGQTTQQHGAVCAPAACTTTPCPHHALCSSALLCSAAPLLLLCCSSAAPLLLLCCSSAAPLLLLCCSAPLLKWPLGSERGAPTLNCDAGDVDGAGLPDAVCAVNGLLLHGGVVPQVCSNQNTSGAACPSQLGVRGHEEKVQLHGEKGAEGAPPPKVGLYHRPA